MWSCGQVKRHDIIKHINILQIKCYRQIIKKKKHLNLVQKTVMRSLRIELFKQYVPHCRVRRQSPVETKHKI